MMNSNYTITKFKTNPETQQIESLEVNNEKLSLGSIPNLYCYPVTNNYENTFVLSDIAVIDTEGAACTVYFLVDGEVKAMEATVSLDVNGSGDAGFNITALNDYLIVSESEGLSFARM